MFTEVFGFVCFFHWEVCIKTVRLDDVSLEISALLECQNFIFCFLPWKETNSVMP